MLIQTIDGVHKDSLTGKGGGLGVRKEVKTKGQEE